MENKNQYPIYLRFWFLWLVLTIVYLLPFLFGFTVENSVSKIIGIFVPYAIADFTFLISASSGSGICLIILLFFLGLTDKYTAALSIRHPLIKLVLNLVILFLLTMLFDFIIWHQFVSWIFFQTGRHPFLSILTRCLS